MSVRRRRAELETMAGELIEVGLARDGEPRHPIGVVAARIEVHANTLRNYERAGLLRPSRIAAGRRYSEADVRWARLLGVLTKRYGLSNDGIRLILVLLERQGGAHPPRRPSGGM